MLTYRTAHNCHGYQDLNGQCCHPTQEDVLADKGDWEEKLRDRLVEYKEATTFTLCTGNLMKTLRAYHNSVAFRALRDIKIRQAAAASAESVQLVTRQFWCEYVLCYCEHPSLQHSLHIVGIQLFQQACACSVHQASVPLAGERERWM